MDCCFCVRTFFGWLVLFFFLLLLLFFFFLICKHFFGCQPKLWARCWSKILNVPRAAVVSGTEALFCCMSAAHCCFTFHFWLSHMNIYCQAVELGMKKRELFSGLLQSIRGVLMLHRCGAMSCLSLRALLGSRGVAQPDYEEGCSVLFFSYFGNLDTLKRKHFFGLAFLNLIHLLTCFQVAEWN